MNYKQIFEILCEFAPISLSDEIVKAENGYDNSGVILANEGEIKGAVFCLDITRGAVDYAIANGCNLIVTHHPAIYRPVKNLGENSPLLKAAANGIAVISMHLNLDCAKQGIDYWFAKGLGGKITEITEPLGENVGYGRISEVSPATIEEIAENYKKTFSTDKVWLYGEKGRKIDKIASFCGAGLDEVAVSAALAHGAQMVASADIPHHVLLSALESGLAVLSCTHYDTEIYGFEKFFLYAKEKLKIEKVFFRRDERLSGAE